MDQCGIGGQAGLQLVRVIAEGTSRLVYVSMRKNGFGVKEMEVAREMMEGGNCELLI